VPYLQQSNTKIVPEEWQDLSQEQNDAQSAAIYEVIGGNGGDVQSLGFSPHHICLTSVISYPDEASAQKAVAEIVALGTLEFVSIEHLWDIGEWTAAMRAANEG